MSRQTVIAVAGLVSLAALCPWVASAQDPVPVDQAWASSGTTYADTDSLAAWVAPDGVARVLATSKKGDRIDEFDAATGRFLRSFGRTGQGEGELRRPNGICTVELPGAGGTPRTAVLIVERDNARVQAVWADTLAPAGLGGGDVLKRPYGIAVGQREGQTLAYVTENDVRPEEMVRVFRVERVGERIEFRHVRNFGQREGVGAIGKPESIAVDDRLDRVLICDESPERKHVKVYASDGTFSGRTLGDGLIQGDPEGLVVLDAPLRAREGGRRGIVLVTDQRPTVSIWHVFDRDTLEHIGAFTGRPTIANTDGICVLPRSFGRFDRGALFAVHDDAELRAYDLGAIYRALEARPVR